MSGQGWTDKKHTVKRSRTSRTLAAAIAFGAVIVALAVVFAGSIEGSAASEQAELFAASEAALGAMTTTQGSVQQALVLSEVDPEGTLEYVSEARSAVAVSVQRFELYQQPASAAEELELRYIDSALDVLEYVEQGDFVTARQVTNGPLSAQYNELATVLGDARTTYQAQLTELGDQADSAAQITRFAVGLAVPLMVGLVMFVAYRRREAERSLASDLANERSLRESREDFIANVSHELRTPLTAVFGFTQLLDAGVIEDAAERDELIRLTYGESGELVRMVEDLLTAARLTEGELSYKLESVSARNEVADVVEVFTRMGSHVEVSMHDGWVRADRLRFRQIVRNILSNAARYGGSVVQISGRQEHTMYRLVIADDGEGVPAETVDSMFERFSQYEDASLARGGLGLGLSIVRTLLEDMGGTIRYERVDGWSRFVIDVPGAAAPKGWQPPRSVSAAPEQPVDAPVGVAGVVTTKPATSVALAGPPGPRPERSTHPSPLPGR